MPHRPSHTSDGSSRPVQDLQPGDAFELSSVVGDHRKPRRPGVACDQHVISTNGRTCVGKARSDFTGVLGRNCISGQHLYEREELINRPPILARFG